MADNEQKSESKQQNVCSFSFKKRINKQQAMRKRKSSSSDGMSAKYQPLDIAFVPSNSIFLFLLGFFLPKVAQILFKN